MHAITAVITSLFWILIFLVAFFLWRKNNKKEECERGNCVVIGVVDGVRAELGRFEYEDHGYNTTGQAWKEAEPHFAKLCLAKQIDIRNYDEVMIATELRLIKINI